jgi:hypothetical protein
MNGDQLLANNKLEDAVGKDVGAMELEKSLQMVERSETAQKFE